jgi:hypothetical protein
MESFCLPPPFNMVNGKDVVKLLLQGDIVTAPAAADPQNHLQIKA